MMQLLTRRESLVGSYHELAQRQKQALTLDDMDALNKALTERAALIEEINAVNKELEKPLERYLAVKAGLGAAAAEPEESIARTRQLLESAQELDRANMGSVRELMRQAGDGVKKMTKSREGIGKYAQRDYMFSPGYIDELK